MTKSLLSLAGLMAFSFSINSYAGPVYTFDYGRWHLNGYVATSSDSAACVLKTEWSDGKRIQVNFFPQDDGSNNVTMTVRNPRWNNPSWLIDDKIKVNLDFTSNQYPDRRLTGIAQIYSDNKVIFRGLSSKFDSVFIAYDEMTVFAGSREELRVSLEGTAGLAANLDECIAAVNGDSLNH